MSQPTPLTLRTLLMAVRLLPAHYRPRTTEQYVSSSVQLAFHTKKVNNTRLPSQITKKISCDEAKLP